MNDERLRWPQFSRADIDAAVRVMSSGRVNYWTGSETSRFENEFAHYCGVEHAVCVASGSLALELAFNVLGIEPGHQVIVTPRTHFSSVASIVRSGLRPLFADVDANSQNLTAATIAAVMSPGVKAILVVHLAGWPAAMPAICALAREHGVYVIEDCSQAHGASIEGRKVGSFADVGTFSFCHDKIMTTCGEGGMLVTRHAQMAERAWSLKEHGKNRRLAQSEHDGASFRWLHDEFGSNWRLAEPAAAVGRSQLQRLDQLIARRRQIAARLDDFFQALEGVQIAVPAPGERHVYYRYYFFVQPGALRRDWNRDRVISALRARGVDCGSGSCPEVYLERAFEGSKLAPTERLPQARALGDTGIALALHSALHDEDVERWMTAIAEVMAQAVRPAPAGSTA